MCGVIGYFAHQPKRQDLSDLKRLALESTIRGLHAFGWGWGTSSVICFSPEEWTDWLNPWTSGPPTSLIGHARYSTSGDWRTEANNQPLVLGGVQLAFNGVIDMGTKTEMEQRYGVTLQTENDGELFLQKLVQSGDEALAWLESLPNTSFAGVWLQAKALMAYRNSRRPLWRHVTPDGRRTLIASTEDIFRRAGIEGAALLRAGELHVATG